MPVNSATEGRPLIDVVMPAYNEEASLPRVIETLFSELGRLPYRFELILVDDGSSDGTAAVVRRYQTQYPITLVSLTRNFGKETALLAGLDHARGDATVIMDADLQHPVALIEQFVTHWEQGYECVYGVKQNRASESLPKRVLTRLFYLGLNRGSGIEIPPNALDFRLLDRAVVHALCSLRERVRFTKGLYAWLGFRSIGVPFVPPPRQGGSSHFNGRALARLGWDGLTSFSDMPLKLAGIVGSLVSMASLAYAFWIAVRTLLFGVDVPGWATLTVAMTFLGGLQILFLGIMGQYVRNVFIETKNRPNYLVRELRRPEPSTATGAPEQNAEPIEPAPMSNQSGEQGRDLESASAAKSNSGKIAAA